jgi:predicted metal-dependent enzyme (double-stranded beta helix superfamily)
MSGKHHRHDKGETRMFDKDQFIADCQAALGGDQIARHVRDLMARAVSDPAAVIKAVGEPGTTGITPLYRSAELTIINVPWQPKMVIMPHNHAMWAVIGVYTGREDNILWRRLPEDADGRVEAAGAKSLAAREAIALGPDVIHSVVNPLARVTGAIHVYGGDFFATQRSEWDPETLGEKPYDMEKVMRMFQK